MFKFRGRHQCQTCCGDPGGAGLVHGSAGVIADPQECVRHGCKQVQEDVEQGIVCVQWEQQKRQPNSRPYH